jgi:predicted TPR repeat methyltransferase
MGHMNDAEKYLKMAATLKSGYADPYFNLGVLFEKAGDNANAVAQYEKFLKTTSDANAPIALQVKKRIESLIAPPESKAN